MGGAFCLTGISGCRGMTASSVSVRSQMSMGAVCRVCWTGGCTPAKRARRASIRGMPRRQDDKGSCRTRRYDNSYICISSHLPNKKHDETISCLLKRNATKKIKIETHLIQPLLLHIRKQPPPQILRTHFFPSLSKKKKPQSIIISNPPTTHHHIRLSQTGQSNPLRHFDSARPPPLQDATNGRSLPALAPRPTRQPDPRGQTAQGPRGPGEVQTQGAGAV